MEVKLTKILPFGKTNLIGLTIALSGKWEVGDKVNFWHDFWEENETLACAYPMIFLNSNQKDESINKVGLWEGNCGVGGYLGIKSGLAGWRKKTGEWCEDRKE